MLSWRKKQHRAWSDLSSNAIELRILVVAFALVVLKVESWSTTIRKYPVPRHTLVTPFDFANGRESDELDAFMIDLAGDRLHLVDTCKGLEGLRSTLSRSVMLGIDTETRPCYKRGEWYPTSLLQVASRDEKKSEDVFIIDLLAIERLGSFEAFDSALSGPFASPQVVKIGVGLRQDFREMAQSYPECKCWRTVNGVINLSTLHNRLNKVFRGQEVSLRNLCSCYLNLNLSKKFQTSKWGKRPLSSGQIEYAACDSLVLLRVYDVLLKSLELENTMFLGRTLKPSDECSGLAPLRRNGRRRKDLHKIKYWNAEVDLWSKS
ncbi:unnamed protein product [Choristocarpus tenellus]